MHPRTNASVLTLIVFVIISVVILVLTLSVGLSLPQIFDIFPKLISIFAFVLAFLALYYAHLKGPDIDLINQKEIKFELVDISDDPKEIRNKSNITRSLRLQPFTLIFVNEGSRTGVIKRLKLTFTQSNEFSSFYVKLDPSFKNPDVSETKTPFPIKNGEVRLVNLATRIEIKNFDSVKEINLPNNIEDADVIAFIKEVNTANKRNLEAFISFLRRRMTLGRCSLQWSTTNREEETELDVTGTYNQIIEWYNSALQKYDELPPSVIKRIDDVKEFLKSRISTLENNLDYIRDFEKSPPLDLLFNKHRSEGYYLVLKWKNKLIGDLESLNTYFIKFNDKRSEYFRRGRDEIMKRHLFKDLEEQKNELEPQINEILKELKETHDAILHSLKQLEIKK